MNVVCYERGLLWTWSVMNLVCYELVCNKRGLLWTRSVMNWSVMNVICYELVCYERGLILMGLLWTGMLWTWSVLNGLFVLSGLLWEGLFWTVTVCWTLKERHLHGYVMWLRSDSSQIISVQSVVWFTSLRIYFRILHLQFFCCII